MTDRLLRALANRIANMIARAVVKLADDTTTLQTLQVGVLAEETRDGVERMQQYGFTSVPLAGAEALVLFVGGRREHGVAVAVDDRDQRLTGLASGEVAIYNDQGAKVVLKTNGDVQVTAKPGSNVVINGGSTPVAKEGSGTVGHTHTHALTAGPWPVLGSIITATDEIATTEGSQTVKVP